ncbi:MAG: glycoside hydrolase family 99-like domain-containing protein [Bacteroidales bacterium]|nr:glycoside hydrolase family 99-like domain-containing protein [Bacteroidales bacterium]
MKVIAFYLPQYHRTKENDEWWGTGFTEWTNVAMAKPLFRGHYQPKIPTELGFYDLRFAEVREEQARLAREAGIDAFCYWHYWFGNGKKLLNMPFEKVVSSGKPDFPFCLAWANHSWYKKSWKSTAKNFELPRGSKLLAEQTYPGLDDIDNHFYYLLSAFRDDRYLKIDNRLVFVIYDPLGMPDWELFKSRWQELSRKEGLGGFFFIAHTLKREYIERIKEKGFDAINFSSHHQAFPKKEAAYGLKKYLSVLRNTYAIKPQVIEYSRAIELMKSELFYDECIYPTIIPNWDHTPRSGNFGTCFNNCTPDLFKDHVNYMLSVIRHKQTPNQVLFLKSWNEWGEGNYMEPDIRYGDAHIRTLKRCLEMFSE